ncbi:MAG: hypothetical protein IAX21_03205 [Candidatus Bathyarchaeota archaeon]|nr:MAG: hypothetical protein IAX21_03205 [Candidatus Bathyarchaeota archaeon]
MFAIFCFSLAFRAAAIFHNEYPPSSDIGFHGSIINLILENGTLPEWNSYHMGGQPLATPVGFHFFVSTLMLFSGMPVILAEIVTAIFFSAIIVFPAYCVAKRMWKTPNAGYIAAFFASISTLSFEMISWGGYTNIISLSLIIIIFYVFLRENDNPTNKHLIIGGILSGALILTHTFSLSVFIPILVVYLIFLIVGKLCKLEKMQIQNMLKFFMITLGAGIVLVSPWIMRVINFYLSASTEGALTGGLENKSIILANHTIEPIILLLIIVLIPALLMLKYSRNRWIDKSSLLLFAWFLVPIVMTQGHLFGIYTDYSRFTYFIDFPGIIIISAGLMYLNRCTTLAINWCPKIRWKKIKKILPTVTFVVAIFVFITASSWSIYPEDAKITADYYTAIKQPEVTTLHWIALNTPEGSVMVADHFMGWWLSGISQRPTLSAAGLEFLIYSHELEIAKAAYLILNTNYQINNGFIQINEDGPYQSRHNPVFIYEKWAGESVGLIFFENNRIVIQSNHQNISLTEMQIDQNTIEYDENLAVLTTIYENEEFTVTKTVKLEKGAKFAELKYDVQSDEIEVFGLGLTMNTTSDEPIFMNITETSKKRIGVFNGYEQVGGQVVLDLAVQVSEMSDKTCYLEYSTQNSSITAKIFVSVFDLKNTVYHHFSKYLDDHETDLLGVSEDYEEPVTVWKYSDMLEEFDVSYVACRDESVYMKFAQDSRYRLVLNCGHVAVFEVTK